MREPINEEQSVPAQIVIDPADGPVRVIHCAGELDMDTVDELRRAGELIANASGAERLILDVSEVTFADSTALNCLLRLHQMMPVTLSGPLHRQFTRLLQVTGTDAVFTLSASIEEARSG
ncbi:STAS domain-containing protein [Streptomyces sp. NPDC053755]|uniref:STAS domain-containing protein n=1 Tax=Streptomyces sp. NPDC053755 TaxID=3155815 RepID=UPI00342C03F2